MFVLLWYYHSKTLDEHARDVAAATHPAARAIFACNPSANEHNANNL